MNPVWSKTPFVLLRYPKLFAAIAGSALILGIAGVSSGLFLSSTANAALEDELSQAGRYAGGLFVRVYDRFDEPRVAEAMESRTEALDRTAQQIGHLQPAVRTLLGTNLQISAVDSPDRLANVKVIARTNAAQHVSILEGDPSSGALISDETVDDLGPIAPGDEIDIPGVAEPITIGAIYKAIYKQPADDYWSLLAEFIYPSAAGNIPPSPMLVDESTFLDMYGEIEAAGEFHWEYPVASPIQMSAARQVDRGIRHFDRAMRIGQPAPDGIGGVAIEEFYGPERFDAPGVTGSRFQVFGVDVFSSMAQVVDNATETVTALRSPVLVLSGIGRIVALLVMAAAGGYIIGTRRTEQTLLAARGVAPWALGARAALEALVPSLLGSIGGAAVAFWLVKQIGPSTLISDQALRRSAIEAAVTLGVGLLVLGLTVLVAARRLLEVHAPRRGLLTRWPWEAVVLLVAGLSYYEIHARGSIAIESRQGSQLDVFVLIFPIMFLVGTAGLAGRLLRLSLPRLRGIGATWGSPAYLANRRLAGAPGMVLGLVTASIMAIAVLVYAESIASTVDLSTRAKAGIFVGSDASVQVFGGSELPSDLPVAATQVRRVDPLTTTNGVQFAMLGVDRDTFAEAAFWDDALADRSLEELLAALEPRPGSPLPVLVAMGDQIESEPLIDLAGQVPVRVVERIGAFPGMTGSKPLMVADVEAMKQTLAAGGSAATTAAEEQIWVKGDPDVSFAALRDNGVMGFNPITQEQVLDKPVLASLTWTLELFRAIGIAAGCIVIMALLLYVQVRQRSTVVSYALARRMTLSRGQHLMFLSLELWAMLLVAIAVGSALAWGVARLIYPQLDVLPDVPPEPFLVVPVLAIAILGGAVIVAACIGALFVQRGADRANVAEVLRVAG